MENYENRQFTRFRDQSNTQLSEIECSFLTLVARQAHYHDEGRRLERITGYGFVWLLWLPFELPYDSKVKWI